MNICPACRSGDLEAFFELDAMPVICNALFATREEALAVPRGDIRLSFCRGCSFVFNRAFDPASLGYGAHYENSLAFSGSFRRYADTLARRLGERYLGADAQVLEIACGSGEFLSLLCEQSGCSGIGLDPSHVPERASTLHPRAALRAEWYDASHARLPVDLIVCRHALEHLEDPLGFLRGIRQGLEERRETALYFEVPNAAWILDEFDLWDLIYEHIGYFGREALVHLFERAGFEVLESGESFERQFLYVEARPGDPTGAGPDPSAMASRIAAFRDVCSERVETWRKELAALSERGGSAAVWGAGSKGVTFLNVFRDSAALGHAVDVNPHKRSMHVSGTGHVIRAPGELDGGEPPDLYIVMNPVYLDEIREQVAALGLPGECRTV